ncbi:MAG TPA: peptidylprolyl isomerase [Ottowia sp.]|uniref:FKBP-type peptidyl-prolyl cis-trans isomerase n=1 Tax=Ottowia sp. TaxID=1898956 RepID=UPI002BF1752B|nr:peptidylprolyl isomerase [Ottowia sp.]MCZ2090184.1 peptidylprolyl isomerase [Burkholderiales bacterium]HNE61128.1 peptidylprolyl isomerase [Ottowia sp.]HNJ45983.1 peptidylprolyl isomerase [Ottowia sp.]HNL42428.1 peptidylprolyl isomerase [Ottowia sp.]HNN34683.1 peptidylprolyl isomerase [Ottowia sp.]
MNITQDTAVTLDYRITDAQGKPLDAGTTAYLHGGYDNLFAKAEAALQGKTVGDKVALALSAAEAFGARDEALARRIPKSEFPPGVKVGGQLQGAGPHGPVVYRVVKIKGPEVLLDANHPLAGLDIRFAATVKAVRAATAEEIAHRHVHGAHGHHH